MDTYVFIWFNLTARDQGKEVEKKLLKAIVWVQDGSWLQIGQASALRCVSLFNMKREAMMLVTLLKGF